MASRSDAEIQAKKEEIEDRMMELWEQKQSSLTPLPDEQDKKAEYNELHSFLKALRWVSEDTDNLQTQSNTR